MTRLFAAWLLVFFALPMSAAAAQVPPDSMPLPPIIQKFVASMRQTRTLSVEVTQTYRFLPVKKPAVVTRSVMSLKKPNKFFVSFGRVGAVSNGQTLVEWDVLFFAQQPPPATLEEMLAKMTHGPLLKSSLPASATFMLFTHPDAFAALPDLKDAGEESVGGVLAHKFISGNARFWFASDTGLPLQAVISSFDASNTIRFLQYKLDGPIPDTVFAAVPPTGLKQLGTGLKFLATETPAPDFTLQTLEGRPVTLSGLKGRVVLLAFCPPYIGSFAEDALALIQKVRSEINAKDLIVLWISETDHPERVAAFVQAHPNAGLTMLLDPPPGPQAVEQKLYHIQSTPTFYVVSQEGQVIAGFAGSLPDKQKAMQADTRAAAISVLRYGSLAGGGLSENAYLANVMDEASLEAALTAAGLGQVRTN